MNYRQIAAELLGKLEDLNYTANNSNFTRTDKRFLTNIFALNIIEAVVNECKLTVLFKDKEDKLKGVAYESNFTIDAVRNIIIELIANGQNVSRSVMSKCIFEKCGLIGVDSDVQIYKGIDSETGRVRAIFSGAYVDEREYHYDREEVEDILRKYARELIFKYVNRKDSPLPRISTFRVFRERLIHRRFTEENFIKEYMNLLSKCSGITNMELLEQSARYKVKQIMSFERKIIESIKNGKAIKILDEESDEFRKLQNQIAAELFELSYSIPNLNSTFSQVEQIFKDAQTQLTAYTKDFSTMTPEEIELAIREINSISISDKSVKYIGENGYKAVDNKIEGKNFALLSKEYVSQAMKLLCKEIHIFVNNSDNLSDEAYVKKAARIICRFIRIHPFPDSNGRTSRALLNALTLNRNILVTIPKDKKGLFVKVSNQINNQLGEDYLRSLYEDSEAANEFEKSITDEFADFIWKNSTGFKRDIPSDGVVNKQIVVENSEIGK